MAANDPLADMLSWRQNKAMPNVKLEASINAIVGLIVARLVYWGGERLGLSAALSFAFAIVIAGATGWLLGSLREKWIIKKSHDR